MDVIETFQESLQEALQHLYDPAYRPPDSLWDAVGVESRSGLKALQSALVQAIDGLRPAPGTPATARGWRLYRLLQLRYVQDLSQEDAAEALGITSRHLRRQQPEALQALALYLVDRDLSVGPTSLPGLSQAPVDSGKPPVSSAEPSTPRRSPVQEELASLQQDAPGRVSVIDETIASVVRIVRDLAASRGIVLEAPQTQAGLVAAIHPAALRQVLVTAIGQLVQCVQDGQVDLRAQREGAHIVLTVTGQPVEQDAWPDGGLIQELLSTQGGTLGIERSHDAICFRLRLPSVGKLVLAVDDNLDILHMYQRYVVGTPYHIIQVAKGQQAAQAVQAYKPDVVVLDVMLPDADGWELLASLHADRLTASIPLVVCSVIREPDLALALGAAACLSKPVRRDEFLATLDRVLSQAAASEPRDRANSAAAC